jgi:glycosyltransferase involved in cell wall biosynthesis
MFGQKTIPSRDGGIEVVVEELATRMAALSNDVTLINRKRKHTKKCPRLTEYKGCHIKEAFTVNFKGLDAVISSFFATLKAKNGHFDIIHVHAEGPCAFLWMLGKHKHSKVIVTIHGLDWQRSKWGHFASWFIRMGEKMAAKYADAVIVLSKNTQKYFQEKYDRKTVLIPNGVSKPHFQAPQIIGEKFSLTKNSYVLFLARIVPEKGLHYLIDAWQGMGDGEKRGKKLVIAGDCFHGSEYYQSILCKVKNDSSIIMTGFVEGKLLEELFSNAFLYVLPSDVEGMPMSLLEALSFENRCLVSDIPENKQIIPDAHCWFKKANVPDLKSKLVSIISESGTSTNFRNISLASWDDVVAQTLAIYKE